MALRQKKKKKEFLGVFLILFVDGHSDDGWHLGTMFLENESLKLPMAGQRGYCSLELPMAGQPRCTCALLDRKRAQDLLELLATVIKFEISR